MRLGSSSESLFSDSLDLFMRQEKSFTQKVVAIYFYKFLNFLNCALQSIE